MDSAIAAFVVLATVFVGILYKYLTRNLNYWKKLDVLGPTPLPLVGNIWEVLSNKISIGVFLQRLYNTSTQPYIGFFIFDGPCLLIRSPKIIKNILSTDYKYFQNRAMANSKYDIFGHTIFVLRNSDWKKTKSALSSEFSSAKVKAMLSIVGDKGKQLNLYLKKKPGDHDAKYVSRKYSIDVIARCFFGVNSHCLHEENSEFEQVGKAMFAFTLRNCFSQTMYFFKEAMVDLLHLQFFDMKVQTFFIALCEDIARKREEMNIETIDFLTTLRNNKDSYVKGQEAALCMEFFGAGFQAASSALAFTLYEMAMNPDVQKKLRQEIVSKAKNMDSLTEDTLNEMKYLTMCIMETQRKYPSLPFLNRRCNMDYSVPDTNLVIKKGTAVYVSTLAIHNDEKYFPEPQKYKPSRFSQTVNEENLIYLPFGYGPRTCIGKRFGLALAKIALVHVLTDFYIEKSERTPDHIEFEPGSFTIQSTVGLPVRFTQIVPANTK